MGKAESDAVCKQRHTPVHHHQDARAVACTYRVPLIAAAALRRRPPARSSGRAARWHTQRPGGCWIRTQKCGNRRGASNTYGLSNPRLSPLAHAAAGAALLRTDVTAPLAIPPVPSPAPSPVASREPISLLALAPLPTPCRPTPVPSLLPRSLPTPKPAPVPTPATSRTSSLVPFADAAPRPAFFSSATLAPPPCSRSSHHTPRHRYRRRGPRPT